MFKMIKRTFVLCNLAVALLFAVNPGGSRQKFVNYVVSQATGKSGQDAQLDIDTEASFSNVAELLGGKATGGTGKPASKQAKTNGGASESWMQDMFFSETGGGFLSGDSGSKYKPVDHGPTIQDNPFIK